MKKSSSLALLKQAETLCIIAKALNKTAKMSNGDLSKTFQIYSDMLNDVSEKIIDTVSKDL